MKRYWLLAVAIGFVCGLARAQDVTVAKGDWQQIPFSSSLTNNKFLITSLVNPKPDEFKDPKYGLTYSWFAYGFAPPTEYKANQMETRFAVFCQSEDELKRAQQVTRLLLRLWDLSQKHLKIDHPIDLRIVEVFLSWGGTQTGGEQLIMTPQPSGMEAPKRRNLIYIYQTSTLKNPVEWVREVAHEYGHALIPGINGYTSPEPWANGLLGERLFIRWIIQEVEAGRMTTEDTMGATLLELKSWAAKYIDPLDQAIWKQGLNFERLTGKDKAAMLEYISLALYVDSAYGHQILERSIKTAGGSRPVDFLNGVNLAVSEQESLSLKIPPAFADLPFFLFLPGSHWSSSGAILAKPENGWVKVKPKTKLNLLKLHHKPSE